MASNREDLKQQVKILVPDNTQRLVKPKSIRDALDLIIDSYLNLVEMGILDPDGTQQQIQSDLQLLQALYVTGLVKLENTLEVAEAVTASKALSVGEGLTVGQGANITGALDVGENSIFQKSLQIVLGLAVGEDSSFAKDLDVGEILTVGNQLFVNGVEIVPYVAPTPTSAAVRMDNVVTGQVITDETPYSIEYTGLPADVEFTDNTRFPKAVNDANPGEDPVNNPATFFPFLYNSTDNLWLDANSPFQANIWQIDIDFSRSDSNNNREFSLTIRQPTDGLDKRIAISLPGGGNFQTGQHQFMFTTISTPNSITEGYEFELECVDINMTLNSVDITRISLENFQS